MANTMSAYGSNTNRPLSEIVGLSTDTKPTDSIEGIKIQNGSSFRELDTGKRFLFDAENTTWNEVSSGGGGGGSTLIEKSISANGIYNASDDSADGYSKVTVDVANSYTQADEGKVVSNGALVAQTAMSSEVTENGTVDTTLYNSVTVNVSSVGGYNAKFEATSTNFTIASCLTEIQIPTEIALISMNAFSSYPNLAKVTMPDTVRTIGSGMFRSCYALTNVILSNNIDNLSEIMFQYCSALEELTIPNGVTILKNSCFDGCSKLNNITLPPNLTTIEKQVFQYCTALTSIIIPDNVTTIGNACFYGCRSLTSIEIGSSVTDIGASCFGECRSLTSIKFKSTIPPTMGSNAWSYVPTSCKIYIPTGTLTDYTTAANYPNPSTYTYIEY